MLLSNYCLTFFPPSLPHWRLLLPLSLHVICNFIYYNSQMKILTNDIQPAQKSLVIIWSQKHFNNKYSTIESAEECFVLGLWLHCLFFFPLSLIALHIWVNTARLVFHPVPAAHPGESKALKTTIHCHSKTKAYWKLGKHAWAHSVKFCHTLNFQFNRSWFHVPLRKSQLLQPINAMDFLGSLPLCSLGSLTMM